MTLPSVSTFQIVQCRDTYKKLRVHNLKQFLTVLEGG